MKLPDLVDDVAIEEQKEKDKFEKLSNKSTATSHSILSFVKGKFSEAKLARNSSGVTRKLIKNALDRSSRYSQAKISQLTKQGQPIIFMPIAETKCVNASAWLQDIENSVGNKGIILEPTPIPHLSADVEEMVKQRIGEELIGALNNGEELPDEQVIAGMQEDMQESVEAELKKEASDRAKGMLTKINDDLLEGNWLEIKKEFRQNCVDFGVGFLKGPIIREEKTLCWDDTGEYTEVTKYIKDGDAPSPLDMFWCPSAKTPNDGYIIERIKDVSKTDLNDWAEYPNYNKKEITALIKNNPDGVTSSDDSEGDGDQRKKVEMRDTAMTNKGFYECYEFWGDISGKILAESGVSGLDATKNYSFQVIWCGDRLIKVMANTDPTGNSIYHKAVWKVIPNAFNGSGVPDLVRSAQDIANAAGRNLIWNMGFSAGAQVAVDLEQMDGNINFKTMFPGKVWPIRSKAGATTKPVDFFQATDNTAKLLATYDRAVAMADDSSGVPQYGYGGDSGKGAAATASGLSMLLNASSRGLKDSMWQMDLAITGYVRRMFVLEMMYGTDDSIKGDCTVITKGSMGVLLKELHQARIAEFLDRVSSPVAMEILGPETYVKTLTEYAELIQIDSEYLLPSLEEIKERMKAQQEAQAEAQQMQAQTQQAEMAGKQEVDNRQVAVKEADQKRKSAETISKIENDVNKRINEEGVKAPMFS